MNNTLKAELKSYFKVVNEREKLLDNELEKYKLNVKERIEEMEKRANIKLHKLAKGYMDGKKFDFEKGRNSSRDRIRFKDGFLERRNYRCHDFYEIDFISHYGHKGDVLEFLPAGFNLAVEKLEGLIREVDELPTHFEKKLKTKIKMMIIDDGKLEKGIVTEIEIVNNPNDDIKFDFNIDGFYAYGNGQNQLYHNDEIFENCLSLINSLKCKHGQLFKRVDRYDKELDRLLNNGCENIIIATRLTE